MASDQINFKVSVDTKPARDKVQRAITELVAVHNLDQCDRDILTKRIAAFDPSGGPREGDYVDFADGVTRRISFVWDSGVQTSDDGSFYLGNGYMSFSGSLYVSVPHETLTLTGETREGSAWFFRHDHRAAHNGVDVDVPVRVWTSTANAPRY